MKSYWMQTVGHKTVLEMRDIERPTPAPTQVLVRLHAASLNRGEFVIGHGLHKGGQASAIGMEGAGVIEALGSEVKSLKVGDKVMGRCRGAFAEYALMDSVEAMHIPATLSFEQAASVPLTFLVVHDMVSLQGKLQPNEWLLIHGVSSGVGVAALQTAKAMGAKVIGTSGSAEKLARLKELGLDAGILTRGENFTEKALQITGGAGAKLAVNLVGGSAFAGCLGVLTDFGRLAVVGYVDGQMLTGLDIEPVHGKRLQIFGLSNAPLSIAMRAVAQRGFEREVMPAIIDGRIVPVIDRTFSFDELPSAKQYVEQNTLLGKVAIRFV